MVITVFAVPYPTGGVTFTDDGLFETVNPTLAKNGKLTIFDEVIIIYPTVMSSLYVQL